MRILVTGGAGFIGSHVSEHLMERGHEVAVVDDLSTGKRENVPDGAWFYEADIRFSCARIFEEFEPEALSHHAARVGVPRSVHRPDFDADVNVLGTFRLLENCVRYGVRKVVFASTATAIYGTQRQFPAAEDHPQYPISLYGVSKLVAEHYLHFYSDQYGLPYVVLRYANVYGPRQDPYSKAGVVASFSRNLAANKFPTINGTGEQTRDYVYVGDVARANVLALESDPPPSGVYNIGTGTETSVNRLYELLRDIACTDLLPRYGPAKPGEQLRTCIDPSRAARVLGWYPQVRLVAGLRKTLEFFGALRPRSNDKDHEESGKYELYPWN